MDASSDKILKNVERVVRGIRPEELFVSAEDAYATALEIEKAIPENCRFLYPEDPILAAIAYAPVYYSLHPLW